MLMREEYNGCLAQFSALINSCSQAEVGFSEVIAFSSPFMTQNFVYYNTSFSEITIIATTILSKIYNP